MRLQKLEPPQESRGVWPSFIFASAILYISGHDSTLCDIGGLLGLHWP
jgi:hypothetical protein